MKKCQCGCGKKLTGRKRQWASDACRKRAKRRHEKSVRFHYQMSAFRPLSPGKSVDMRLLIDSDGQYPYLYEDRWGLQLAIQSVCGSNKMRNLVREELERRIPGYKFQVTILSGRG